MLRPSGRLTALFVLLLCEAVAWSAPKSIRVVSDYNYPPYLFLDAAGKPEGYEVDLWKLWEQKTGVHVELSPMQWQDAQTALLQGRADVIDMIFRGPGRDPYYRFSDPYATLPVGIYVDRTIRGIHNVDTLRGFLVGVERGDACVQKLQDAGINSISLYPNYDSVIAAAQKGEIKVFCMDEGPANYYLYQKNAQLSFGKAFDFYEGQFHWAVRKGDDATFQLIAAGMARITPDEKSQLQQRWFMKPLELLPYWRLFRYGLLAAIAGFLLLLLWIWSLREVVLAKTTELSDKNKKLSEQAAELAQEKAHLQTIIESSPDAIWVKNREGVYVECNAALSKMLGTERDDLLGKVDADLHPDATELRLILEHDRNALESDSEKRREVRFVTKDGIVHDLEVSKVPVRAAGGEITGVLGIGRDITERKRSEGELRIAAVAFQSHEGILVTNNTGTIQRVNEAFAQITGYPPKEVIGQRPMILDSGMHNPEFYSAIVQDIHSKGIWQGNMWCRKKSGELFLGRMTISSVTDEAGTVQHYVGMMTDETAENTARTRADRLEKFDSLTDLPNRTQLEERLARILKAAGPDQHGALILIDLDNFAIINNVHGHRVGDVVLRLAAQRMNLMIPDSAILARFSGDEFAVISLFAGDSPQSALDRASAVANSLHDALEQPYQIDEVGTILCTASIGITLLSKSEGSVDALLAKAELAMYKGKESGKNAVRFFVPEMQHEVEETDHALQ